ncbi:hypothetical protein [Methylovorus mays]|uniref:hypothetical protein n=1 Tax=Methylovorus mays TaxID=184077 RepID=UPI001E5C5971|nr:hypothetical protein [Methylovorus mays]MCB5207795.1 hypothetical protein [Methylovorus mays]
MKTVFSSALLLMSIIITGCSDGGSILIGKWQAQDIGSSDAAIQAAIANPKKGGGIREFTETEYISAMGSRVPIEYKQTASNEVIVYQHVLGTKYGETYKIIDSDNVILKSAGRTFLLHRVK